MNEGLNFCNWVFGEDFEILDIEEMTARAYEMKDKMEIPFVCSGDIREDILEIIDFWVKY